MTNQKLGISWTETKFEVLRRYLDVYTIALNNKCFILMYIDAFSGFRNLQINR